MITIQDPVVQVRFTVAEDDGSNPFGDAVNLTVAEHAALKPGDIEIVAQKRYTNWKSFVFAQSNLPPEILTKEDIQMQLDEIVINRLSLDSTEQELLAKLDTAPDADTKG